MATVETKALRKEFTGHTPTGYMALRQRFPAEPGFPPDSGPMPAD